MGETHYLLDILILLAAAVISVPLFQRLRLGAVLGYLAAGAAIGPWGLGFISQIEDIRTIAEFGVIFLLFSIGIEMKPARLWAMRRVVLGLGGLQVIVTGLAIMGVALLLGQPLNLAAIIGFGLALSSTAFCLQILTERGEIASHHGRAAFSILLLQDLAVVPLLVLVSLLAAGDSALADVELVLLESLIVIVGVILAGRFVLAPFLQLVAASQALEVFTAAVLLAVLGIAWLIGAAGLSMALGAFLAGVMLADSHFRHQVVADIRPFRGMLLGLFFMGVGMTIDFGLLADRALVFALLVPGLLVTKSLILWMLCRIMGLGKSDTPGVALLLSQSGEFGFAIFGLAMIEGLIDLALFQFLTLLVVLSMVTTPLMATLADWQRRRSDRPGERHNVSTNHIKPEQTHVIVAGFGRVGRRVARILSTADVPYLVIEQNADKVSEGRREGFSVFYGDAGHVDVLKAAGADRVEILVSTLDKVEPGIRLVSTVRQNYPELAVFARGHDRQHCDELVKAGATIAISESLEASLQIGEEVLVAAGLGHYQISALMKAFRQEYYG
jgi:CPA2 family monovalent cation:H+ antiporter-2/glutathione-regulated potassium-efflux system protein KefB